MNNAGGAPRRLVPREMTSAGFGADAETAAQIGVPQNGGNALGHCRGIPGIKE